MTTLTVRRLGVDLRTPLPRHWNGGCPFRTAFFNALSMSFPAGEQVFIDAMRLGVATLPEAERAKWAAEVQGFIGQEATHRRVHTLFNEHLARQGLANRWEERILKRRQRMEGIDPRNWLAVTAATEHFTAIFAEHLLAHPQLLQGSEDRLRDLWVWHSCEEIEHRATAFELYRALGGNEEWRLRIFKVVSWHFATDALRQTLNNLWHDGSWWRPATWAGAWRTLFGAHGLVRHALPLWRKYLKSDFHPLQADGSVATRWLQEHAALAPPVNEALAPPVQGEAAAAA